MPGTGRRDRAAHLDVLLGLLKAGSALLRLDLLGRQLRAHGIRGRPRLRQRQLEVLGLVLQRFPGCRRLSALRAQAFPDRGDLSVGVRPRRVCARLCRFPCRSLLLRAAAFLSLLCTAHPQRCHHPCSLGSNLITQKIFTSTACKAARLGNVL